MATPKWRKQVAFLRKFFDGNFPVIAEVINAQAEEDKGTILYWLKVAQSEMDNLINELD